MDRTVPAGAARILDFIRDTEVGTDDRAGYDIIYGMNQGKLPKPVTSMTVDEVLASQASWSSRFGSSATGGYQFMRETLGDLKRELGLSGAQVLDPDLQDRLAYHLLKRRGYEAFIAGTITNTEFGKRLAMEWASLPVLAGTQGAHRRLSRGQSYYAGDKLNKALVPPETVEAVIAEARAIATSTPAVIPMEEPVMKTDPAAPLPPRRPTPVQQSRKAIGGGAFAALLACLAQVAVIAGWLPVAFSDPNVIAGLVAVVSFIGGAVGAYYPRNEA